MDAAYNNKQSSFNPILMDIDEGINQLPEEMIIKIFSKLRPADLERSGIVCKKWQVLASDKLLWDAMSPPEIAFGAKQWLEFFGVDIGEVPPLPKNIDQILQSDCPIWEGKKVGETHMLVLVPKVIKTANGEEEPLTINNFGKLIKPYFPDNKDKEDGYRYFWTEIIKEQGDKPIDKSCWVLMTKDVLPDSRKVNYTKQQNIVAELAKKTKADYKVPNALAAIVSIITQYVKTSGTYLFNDNPRTYTRCQEEIRDCQVVVGGFAPAGLLVLFFDNYDLVTIGIAALRKF